jgi:dipeptidyl aminopeptidase/acylaminoacyl peptidase
MTTFERFERSIPTLMDELAPARVPDYVDDMLRQTAAQRQRPAWSYPERWLPVEITARPLTTRSFPWRPLLILALVAALIAAALVAYVGSRPTVPPPFGVADNGLLIYRDPDGSIRSLDPRSLSEATVAPASARLGDPVPSRDGRRIAFIPRSSTPSPIIVADIDGTNRAALSGEHRDIEAVDWSPDGSHIAFLANGGDRAVITVAAVDGSAAQPLAIGRDVWQLRYLPDGRLAFIAPDQPADPCPGEDAARSSCALFVIKPDGTGLERVLSAIAFRGLTIDPSPDGTSLLYVEWAPGAEGRLHVVDLRDGTDRPVTDGFPEVYSINQASFSPDGTSILFDLYEADGDHWAVVPTTGGPIVRIGPEWPGDTPEAFWAPDGRAVLSIYPIVGGRSESWLLDPTGGGADRRLEVDLPVRPEWQRVGTQGAS